MYYGTKFKRYQRVYSDYKLTSLTSIPGPSTLFDSQQVTTDTCMYPPRDILYICNLVIFQVFSTIRKKKELC